MMEGHRNSPKLSYSPTSDWKTGNRKTGDETGDKKTGDTEQFAPHCLMSK
jgi:hypothetical protein